MLYTLAIPFIYFLVYAILGWGCEVIFCSIPQKKFINRGFLNGPYCPIYGVGASVIVLFLGPYVKYPIAVFLVGMFTTSLLEYMTSWGMEKIFHAKWWDYSKNKFNLNGRICLKNAFLFGLMSLLLMYLVHPFIKNMLERFSPFWLEIIALVSAIIFLGDLFESTRETMVFNKKLKSIYENTLELKESLKNKGIKTAHDLSEKMKEFKAGQLSSDASHKIVKHLFNRITEKKKLNCYSHRRIINAFPGMKHHHHQDSLDVYKACLASEKDCKKSQTQ